MSKRQTERPRFVTAASLFDGHDVSINIMRRMLQEKGVEVIHLGHNRSAQEVADAAICEDAHAVAISSYQGGHNEYFRYVKTILKESGADNIRIFGGGGGVITPSEIASLEEEGIDKIYSPADGTKLGLEGIIDDMIKRAEHSTTADLEKENWKPLNDSKDGLTGLSRSGLAKIISYIENNQEIPAPILEKLKTAGQSKTPVFGITGTGGAGKSSLIDELLHRFMRIYPNKKVCLYSIDPTRKRTQGALLGDRIRLCNANTNQFFVRSLATRTSGNELSPSIHKVLEFTQSQDFDLIIVESSGIGQGNDKILEIADLGMYVMTPEYGAQSQLEKIEMLDSADFIAINKFDRPKAKDALRDVRKQFRRNRNSFQADDNSLPVYGTIASQFNDTGVNQLFYDMAMKLGFEDSNSIVWGDKTKASEKAESIIPANRLHYLAEISETLRSYQAKNNETEEKIAKLEALESTQKILEDNNHKASTEISSLIDQTKEDIGSTALEELKNFQNTVKQYQSGTFKYSVRGKDFEVPTKYESLSRQNISKVAFPKYRSRAEQYRFIKKENLPGHFPFSAGIFPFKRADEEPKRQFAGEGGPSRTNKRFHYLCDGEKSKRLSTAFDSVTLYGEDPHERPDIFGKIGESGVSIATLEDMSDLYKGFDLTDPYTSVSKTINGPAPIILAMFMNTAIYQKLSPEERNDPDKCLEVMRQVRGTIQADILKEDQAQNTCIFSLDFALKMMGDIQAYFSKNKITNYYTVSISGYHIAEAGANPITQLAFTLSNGFSYVEYYLSRGISIDSFCENLSFFFSNGLDPEYTVLGRVARKIWAVTMRDRYGANIKSQKLKYHIQTSGRSLHAQEIAFNDIRTTLQAFLALSDNCNSLHTNAYDEAITTPTEESVRRAMAIQLIINREFGMNKTDNPLQGSYLVEELCDIVEEAVLKEFEEISKRGGVLGAMESMYQRGKIQDESIYYESLKDSGQFPIIGVNTYLSSDDHGEIEEIEMSRASDEEKNEQINRLRRFQSEHAAKSEDALQALEKVALSGGNIFEELLQTVRYCSLGQITQVLYKIGGRYRRNM